MKKTLGFRCVVFTIENRKPKTTQIQETLALLPPPLTSSPSPPPPPPPPYIDSAQSRSSSHGDSSTAWKWMLLMAFILLVRPSAGLYYPIYRYGSFDLSSVWIMLSSLRKRTLHVDQVHSDQGFSFSAQAIGNYCGIRIRLP